MTIRKVKVANCPHCLKLTGLEENICQWCGLPLRPPPPPVPVSAAKKPPAKKGFRFRSLRSRLKDSREKGKRAPPKKKGWFW